MNEDLLEKTLLYIKERFQNDHSGHDYYHSVRVYKLATSICKEENADLEIIQLSSLLHDVDDYKLFGGNVGTYSNAETFLKDNKISDTKIRIIHIPDEKPHDNMNFEEYSTSNGTCINHFYEKLLKLKDLMNTKAAKEMAESRHKYMENFLSEFFNEWDGRI